VKNLRRHRSLGNVSTNVYAKFRCAPLRIKKSLRDFWTLTELITTTTRLELRCLFGTGLPDPKRLFGLKTIV